MESKNETHHGFILLGFSEMPHLRLQLISFFFTTYILCISGNFLIFTLIVSQHQLHAPMYLLLGNLAMVDITFTSIIIPRALYGLLSGDTNISFHGCFLQLFFFLAVGNMDSFLLAIMALDRYAAVCHPLRYLMIMNKRTCICLVASSWVVVSLHSTLYTVVTSTHDLCAWVVHHFFCDLPVITLLFCPNTVDKEQMILFIEGTTVIFSPVLFILVSYILIISAVLKLDSDLQICKWFSEAVGYPLIILGTGPRQCGKFIVMFLQPLPSANTDLLSPERSQMGRALCCLHQMWSHPSMIQQKVGHITPEDLLPFANIH
ncbi:olfactory receptor-like protein DTMT [Dendropsophus ebraccatus]|uniref:olfactory receptor-like protein DTMT n=1 Tax=Dendropsophus ebraccatus TaxID=150705 RepID=UPI0038320DD1